MERVYALYMGDEIMALGTAKEIAEHLSITVETVWFYGTPRYKRQCEQRKTPYEKTRFLVRIEDDD